MASWPYAVLTDGTTTITFADGSGGSTWYDIGNSWGPKIARLRQSQLGGYGPYENVDEEMSVTIAGSTATHLYANLDALNRLIDQAARWYRGENQTAVLFKYSPTAATVSTSASPLQAAVLGGALELPANFHDAGNNLKLMDATLRFTRRGLWLHTAASASAAGSNGDVVTVAIGNAAEVNSPTRVQWSNVPVDRNQVYPSYVLLGNGASQIVNIHAENLTGSFWSQVAASAALARGGSILRYTNPALTDWVNSGAYNITASVASTARAIFVYANIAGSSSNTSTFLVKARIDDGYGYYETNPPIVVAGSSVIPKWYPIGFIQTATVPQTIQLAAKCSASGADTLNFDSVVLFDATDPEYGGVVKVHQKANQSTTASGASAVLDHALLSQPAPTFTLNSIGFPSDKIVFTTRAASVYCLWLCTAGATGVNWRDDYGSAGSIKLNTWTITRTRAYLSPV